MSTHRCDREKLSAGPGYSAGCSVTSAMPAPLIVDFKACSAWRITDAHQQQLDGF
jgi:hypothetical protein